MMSLDTEVKGDHGSVMAAADWARSTLAPAVDKSADALVAARSDAASDWDGSAGSAFRLNDEVGLQQG